MRLTYAKLLIKKVWFYKTFPIASYEQVGCYFISFGLIAKFVA